MILDENERTKVVYLDSNNQFEDTTHSIRVRNHLNAWAEEEKSEFVQRFLEYPKEFGRIATFIPNKSAQGIHYSLGRDIGYHDRMNKF
jgi:hypothetical protein